MAGVIWEKAGASIDARIQRFCAGDDVVLDRALFLADIRASKAHVHGLLRAHVLAAHEAATIDVALGELATEFEAGRFVLDDRYEDGHSAIEAYLTERVGEAGKKVHTGRSRNDQVLVALRLMVRDMLARIEGAVIEAADGFLARAEELERVPMPGYTHLQRAVPSSVGLWMAAFAEAFIDDAALLRETSRWMDACPLGTAAGYGVNLPLDRQGVSDELGFARLLVNPMYAQNSRGKLELAALGALLQALFDVRRFAWDLSLYTTAEFAFVKLPAEYTTGSSIMPNKKNPDVIELLRASPSVVQGAMTEIQSLLSLPSGYHRDLQATKGPVVRALFHGAEALGLVPELVRRIELDVERMARAITPDLYATDAAVELAVQGVPFRTAYRQVADGLAGLAARTPAESLAARVSPGATADLMLGVLRDRLAALHLAR
jgi:argininosuccinate lyase